MSVCVRVCVCVVVVVVFLQRPPIFTVTALAYATHCMQSDTLSLVSAALSIAKFCIGHRGYLYAAHISTNRRARLIVAVALPHPTQQKTVRTFTRVCQAIYSQRVRLNKHRFSRAGSTGQEKTNSTRLC